MTEERERERESLRGAAGGGGGRQWEVAGAVALAEGWRRWRNVEAAVSAGLGDGREKERESEDLSLDGRERERERGSPKSVRNIKPWHNNALGSFIHTHELRLLWTACACGGHGGIPFHSPEYEEAMHIVQRGMDTRQHTTREALVLDN